MIRHCAPTLAGMKTGSLFSCHYDSEEAVCKDIRAMNQSLVPKGLRVLCLKYQSGLALIYLYRPNRLCQDLTDPIAAHLLEDRGYPCANADRCVVVLVNKLRCSGEFPHEIGLFLGYPPIDVEGFITHRAQDFKCVGDWKVYGDEEQAKKTFARYRACTECYHAQWCSGKSVEQLTVTA